MIRPASVLALALLATNVFATPTVDELAEIVAAQQDQIDQLRDHKNRSATHIGGYGELHYNMVEDGDDQIDFHRFVLFFGHDFNTRLRFRSEFELEHALTAGGDAPGEVELEQAYLEYDLAPGQFLRGGVMLVPVGILNETHEPPSFYGVERNRIENRIIPATWWEAGLGLGGRFQDSSLSYELMLHSGLEVNIESGNPIRGGRQKVAEAIANDWALTGRVRYQGISGLDLAATAQYQSDVSQDGQDGVDDALLFSAHAIYTRGLFGVRALYARWTINGERPKALNKDKISGWYLEPNLRLCEQLGLFARYSAHELVQGREETNSNLGINYWPHPQVVIKADYEQRDNANNSERNSLNLGLGYQF